MGTILEANNVSKNFDGLKAIDNLDVQIQEGEIFGLIGPNGSGKTTMLNVTTGFLKPEAGEIKYKGDPINGLESHQIAEKGIIRTFQHAHCLNELTAKENVVAGRYLRASDSILGSVFKTRSYKEEIKKLLQKAEEVLIFLGMEKRIESLAGSLSPGEQRKLEIGIALAAEPELLLLDEPAAGLNTRECDELIKIIRSIRDEGTAVVIVEHNMKVVMNLCTQIMVINFGKKVTEGTPEEIVENKDVISLYLGENVHATDK